MAPRTAISICSRALMNLGASPINSFEGGADAATFLKVAYPEIVENVTAAYAWECMKVKEELTREGNVTPPGYRYSFIMPGDMIGAPGGIATSDAPWSLTTSGFEVRSRRIVSNHPRLWVEYSTVRPESEWPAWFAELIVGAVCAELAFMITDQQNVKDHWEVKTWGTPSENRLGGLFGTAMALDAQGSGNNPGLANNAFVDARFGGVYPGDWL